MFFFFFTFPNGYVCNIRWGVLSSCNGLHILHWNKLIKVLFYHNIGQIRELLTTMPYICFYDTRQIEAPLSVLTSLATLKWRCPSFSPETSYIWQWIRWTTQRAPGFERKHIKCRRKWRFWISLCIANHKDHWGEKQYCKQCGAPEATMQHYLLNCEHTQFPQPLLLGRWNGYTSRQPRWSSKALGQPGQWPPW